MNENAKPFNERRLFAASCMSLIATSVSFAVVGDIMGDLKSEYLLTNEDVGWIGGAQLWGFPLTIFVFGAICDVVGMKNLFRLAFLGHLIASLVMIFSTGFWGFFFGALGMGMANGLVEAAGNPLVASIYPDKKTEKLNQFHVWFPGGIAIGGVLCYLLATNASPFSGYAGLWKIKLCLIIVPTLIYGVMFFGQKLPVTERVESGVTFGQMFASTFSRPLFWILMVCMMMTATVELGPNRWIPAVLGAAGMSGILILAWINGLMGVMRQFAGPVVHRLSPTGILLASSVISGVGLWWLSYAESLPVAFASSTVFAIGICYFWPTMLGVMSERVPKGGALALGLLGGTGALTVGLFAVPIMGKVGDEIGHEKIAAVEARAVLDSAVEVLPAKASAAEGETGQDIVAATAQIQGVIDEASSDGELPPVKTAMALRTAALYGGDEIKERAETLLSPADNYGGRRSFRYISTLAIALTALFGLLFIRDRIRGGYKAEKIGGEQ